MNDFYIVFEGEDSSLPVSDSSVESSGESAVDSSVEIEVVSSHTEVSSSPSFFDVPFEDYSVTEGLLLVCVLVILGSLFIGKLKR